MKMELKTYEEARDWLYSLKNRGSSYGLERMEHFAKALGNPQNAYPIIHVAGTNGKGSTAAMLEAIFRAHGFKTGLSTSPHLVRQGERIQVNRSILDESQILEYTRELVEEANVIAEMNPEMHPSFFEFMTAMAFRHFQRENVDIAIVEVGLGGRLDASNVVIPEVSVITSIGLDHCEILGDTLEAIAREKAGIIKGGLPTVIGHLPPEAESVIRSICQKRKSSLISVAEEFGNDVSTYPQTNLVGGCQRLNAATALAVARVLESRFNLDEEISVSTLKDVYWPGRWEERDLEHRKIIFDVTHNSDGAQWLEENLSQMTEKGIPKPDVIFGVMGDDRANLLVPLIARFAKSITFVVPQQARSSTFESLESFVPRSFSGSVVRGSVPELFPSRGECSLDVLGTGPILVTGSIYLIGEIWERFMEDGPLGQGILQDF